MTTYIVQIKIPKKGKVNKVNLLPEDVEVRDIRVRANNVMMIPWKVKNRYKRAVIIGVVEAGI